MTTVGSLYEKYQALILGNRRPGTARAYDVGWRHRAGPSFATCDIESLTTLDIEVEMAAWSGSLSTRIDALSVLSAICRVAVKGGILTANPCIGVERPRRQKSDPTTRALSYEQVEKLIDSLPADGPYRWFVLALLYTGCRLGEVAGLRVSDVDWSGPVIMVRRTASAGMHGELVVGDTKGRRVRAVPLAPPLVPIVRQASEGKGPHDLLFPGPRGGTINSKNLSRALNWPVIRESIKSFPPDERPLHWHDLRHTAAVVLFHAGLSAPDVQAILGHSSLLVTQQYADTRNDAARRGSVLLGNYYESNSKGQSRGGDEVAKTVSDQEI